MKKIILPALLLLSSTLTASSEFTNDSDSARTRLSSAAQDSVSAQSNSSNEMQTQKSFKVVYTRSSKTSYGFSVYFGDELCFEGTSSFTTSYSHEVKTIGHDFNPLTRKDITDSLQTFKANLSFQAQNMINNMTAATIEHRITGNFTEEERLHFLSLCDSATKSKY